MEKALEKLRDPEWRLFSGELYKIVIKDENDPDAEGLILPFKPNNAQRRFIKRIWNRNIILKSRQLGFTTLICIAWLDYALFNPNAKCGVIAQTDATAMNIFKDKVEFAYNHLPDWLKSLMPLSTQNAHELEFAHNGSSLRVATSMRSGTYHRLLISEFGKICATSPAKAKEVISGSIPSVPITGLLVIESTAEGRQGSFFTMTQAAIKLSKAGRALTKKEYRFHFFAWFEDEGYRMSPEGIEITKEDEDYFYTVEATMGVTLDIEQKAWYIATRKEFEDAGSVELMLQEYPSTPEEAFQKSLAGVYYAKEMAKMRKEKRICAVPILDVPCNTFWDIGGTAGTALWVIQTVGLQDRAIDYYEAHNESYAHFKRWLDTSGYLYNKHFFPHDADHKRQGADANMSPKELAESVGITNIEIVPQISSLDVGIELTKKYMAQIWIDEERCAKGIERLDGYKRKFDTKQQTWRNEPEKMDGNSEGADALRDWAQAKELRLITMAGSTKLTRKKTDSWKVI